MKATGGASRDAGGFAGLMLIFVVLGLVIAGVMLAPNLVLKINARQRRAEEGAVTRLKSTFERAVERTQYIPGPTNWSTRLLPFADQDQTLVEQTWSDFASDTNVTRVFLVDPGLSSGLLPYTQGTNGLTGTQTNLLRTNARVMLVSNTKRSLALPVTSGTPTSNMFYSLWNWAYDPATRSPPAAFGAGWTGFGEYLHVQRVNLANLFHRVTMNNLAYQVGETSSVPTVVSVETAYYFLRGTRLILARTDGTLQRIHVVNRDIGFDFGSSTPTPIAWWKFSETDGSVATNSGSLGTSANGSYTNGVTLGSAGPRPPAFSGFSSGNTAATFDGSDDYVQGTNNLLNNFTAFTIAGWINPSTASLNNQDLFGQQGIAGFAFTTAGKLELCDDITKKLHYFYPYGAGEWHHIAGVGDGSNMYIYADGVLVASRTCSTASYGSNSNPFNIGAKVFTSGNYFNGLIDEVVVYDSVLNAGQIAQLYAGTLP